MNVQAIEKWNIWPSEQHSTEYAQKRIKSAKSSKLTPIMIDETELFGCFQGSSGKYQTYLDYCPCGDFHRSKLPCKHIYRLAMELGVFESDFKSDSAAIPTPKKEREPLSLTLDTVESLSLDAQHQLLGLLRTFSSNNRNLKVILNPAIDELLSSGLIIENGSRYFSLSSGKKDDLYHFLIEHGSNVKKGYKKSVLESICLSDYFDEAKSKFGINTNLTVTIPTKFDARNMHYFLHRKLDSEYIYYGDDYKAVSCLEMFLPDDIVTLELSKRGYLD